MTFPQALLLFLAAIIGGTLNSVAGGGSFFTFPALTLTGVPLINANATSTVALWPGSLASAGAYRDTFTTERRMLLLLSAVSILGGILGAVILIKTPEIVFRRAVPFLLLAATAFFAYGGQMTAALRARRGERELHLPSWIGMVSTLVLQFIIALYGGFFGGGIGIMMLAVLAVTGMKDIHAMNALKTVLTICINGVAVVTFAFAGFVFWPQALVMVVGAVAGGYGGASIARKIDPLLVRRFVIVVGVVLSILFFLKYTIGVI